MIKMYLCKKYNLIPQTWQKDSARMDTEKEPHSLEGPELHSTSGSANQMKDLHCYCACHSHLQMRASHRDCCTFAELLENAMERNICHNQ